MKRTAAILLTCGFVAGLALFTQPAAAAPGRMSATMNRVLPETKFTGVTLGDAVEFLRDVSGANITVDWKALEAIAVGRDTTVNLRLRAVPLRKVLAVLLNEAGGGGQLTYVIDDGVIEITTREKADQRLVIRVYPVDDILMEIPQFTDAPDFNLQQNTSGGGRSGGGGGAAGGGGMGLFGGNTGTQQQEVGKTRDERAADLITLIVETIRPEIWREAGGPASIRFFNGNLVIAAPISVHEMIGGPLE